MHYMLWTYLLARKRLPIGLVELADIDKVIFAKCADLYSALRRYL